MSSIKCKNCGLSNFSTDAECRRCGYSFLQRSQKRKQRTRRPLSVWSLLMIAAVLGVVYYFYNGVQQSMNEVTTEQAQRTAQPVRSNQTPGLSRSQSDQQRAGHFGDAIRNSEGLNAHDQRTRETEKALQQVSNSR